MTAESSDTLRRLMPWLDVLGITRLGDITGLDRIGIPVVQAVRPLGLADCVTQGKGRDLAGAAVCAIMEAAEQFFAERIACFQTMSASAEALGVSLEPLARHLRPDAPPDWAAVETAWVEATDLLAGRPGWLPFELVHTAYIEPAIPTDGLFSASTTGLACAFSERQATIHALQECVERDAIAKAHRTHGFFQRHRIDPVTTEDADLLELVDIVRDAGLFAALWKAPAAGHIEVVWCQVMEDGSRPLIMPYAADGFAADLNQASAARRALLEAVQSRLAAISGARDDITRASFPAHTDWEAIQAHRRLLANGPMPLAFDAHDGKVETSDCERLDQLLGRLASEGLSAVLRARIATEPCPEIAAVRVFVPDLQSLTEG
jgi:YcaO-like protein with predicted kinase domain